MKAFVALVFVLIGLIILDLLVSLSKLVFLPKTIVDLIVLLFRKKNRRDKSNETGDSRSLSKDEMDNLPDELEGIINDESLSDETKAKKQLEVFQKYGINPGAEEQQEDALKHEELDENKIKKRLDALGKYETDHAKKERRKGTIKREVLFVIILSLFVLNAVYPLITSDFSPNIDLSSRYLLISIAITLPASAFLIHVLWESNRKVVQKRSFLDKVEFNIALFFLPLLVLAVAWFNVAIAVPRFYTAYYGTESVVEDFGFKRERVGRQTRSLSCEFVISTDSLQGPFGWCLSQEEYDELPDTKFPVRVHRKTTVYGTVVTSLTALPGADPEGRKRYFDACIEKETSKILRRYRIDLDEKLAVLRKKAIEAREGVSIEKMAEQACNRFQ
jgi:hypothetical protein